MLTMVKGIILLHGYISMTSKVHVVTSTTLQGHHEFKMDGMYAKKKTKQPTKLDISMP